MRSLCLPVQLTPSEFGRLDTIICATRHVRQGDTLFRADDDFQSIYAVRAGSFKTVMMHRDGREQVTGFQIAGETLGMDGIGNGHHCCDAIALEDALLLHIPQPALLALLDATPQHWRQFALLMAQKLRLSFLTVEAMSVMPAAQRLAARLLMIADGYGGISAGRTRIRL